MCSFLNSVHSQSLRLQRRHGLPRSLLAQPLMVATFPQHNRHPVIHLQYDYRKDEKAASLCSSLLVLQAIMREEIRCRKKAIGEGYNNLLFHEILKVGLPGPLTFCAWVVPTTSSRVWPWTPTGTSRLPWKAVASKCEVVKGIVMDDKAMRFVDRERGVPKLWCRQGSPACSCQCAGQPHSHLSKA